MNDIDNMDHLKDYIDMKSYKSMPKNLEIKDEYISTKNEQPNNINNVEKPFLTNRLPRDIGEGLYQLGVEAINTPHNLANLISTSLGSKIGKMTAHEVPKDLRNLSDKIVQGGISMAPYFTPFGLEGKLSESILSNGPKLLKSATSGIEKILPQSLLGAALTSPKEEMGSQNPQRTNAMENAAIQGGISSIPFLGHQLGKLANEINPLDTKNKIIESMQKYYSNSKEAQKDAYSYSKKYNEIPVTNDAENFLDFSKSEKRRFTPMIKKAYIDFIENPVFENLHQLQSRMYKDAKGLKNQSLESSQSIQLSRDKTLNKLYDFLSRDPEALSKYKEGADITKNEIKPYELKSNVKNIVKGNVDDITAYQLKNRLNTLLENKSDDIPLNHPLRQLNDELSKKLKGFLPTILNTMVPDRFLPILQHKAIRENSNSILNKKDILAKALMALNQNNPNYGD